MPAPLEHVHVQQRRVGHLQEPDPLARDAGERGSVVAAREHVEGVDRQGDGWVVGPAYGLPGLADPVDVPTPGEGLEGQRPRRARRPRRRGVQLLGDQVEVVDRVGADVGAGQHHRRAELARDVELARHPAQRVAEAAPARRPPRRAPAGTGRRSGRARRTAPRPRAGRAGTPTRSLSKTSTPSKPAAAMAGSLSASRPLTESVATPGASGGQLLEVTAHPGGVGRVGR